jgi:hypothetical protein
VVASNAGVGRGRVGAWWRPGSHRRGSLAATDGRLYQVADRMMEAVRGGERRVDLRRMLALTQRRTGDAVTSPARLRPSEVLAAQIAALSPTTKTTSSELVRGALDALHWLIGGGPGPLTADAVHTPVTVRAVVHQLAAAEAVIHGRRRDRREHAQGVEHALMWGQYATAAPPVPPHATTRRHRTAHLRDQAVG